MVSRRSYVTMIHGRSLTQGNAAWGYNVGQATISRLSDNG
jgi:hypothetical protein